MATPGVLDAYRPGDRQAMYDICLRTGDDGADATQRYRDGALLGEVYVGPYLALEPELARVVRTGDGRVSGYVVAAADTAAFEERCAERWWPALRRRYPLPAASDRSPDAELVRMIHAGVRTEAPWLAEHPAHLHIDLLPEAQGRGLGRGLIDDLRGRLAARGVPGVHLAVSETNTGAVAFYRRVGFAELERRPGTLFLGSRTAPGERPGATRPTLSP